MITDIYRPEGALLESVQNREYLSSLAGLERAMSRGAIVEGIATLCDEEMRLHVDLHCARGIIEAEDTVACRVGETKKDIDRCRSPHNSDRKPRHQDPPLPRQRVGRLLRRSPLCRRIGLQARFPHRARLPHQSRRLGVFAGFRMSCEACQGRG